MTVLEEKIELVQNTFKEGKDKANSIADLGELNDWLQTVPNEFISVAYEGASMAIALESIKETNSLDRWNEFYDRFGKLHGFQMHVGLGWAFSILNLDLADVNFTFDPLLKGRVLDGYGYFEGVFKRRQTIRTQQIPSHLSKLDIKGYDQGLGRSLWYISHGEIEKLVKLISLFSANRHHDLWRGIGIAVTYVGGVEPLKLDQLLTESGEHIVAFKSGVSLLIHSRSKSITIVTDTEDICDFLFKVNCSVINDQLIKLEEESKDIPELQYPDWVKRIEESFI